MQFSLLTALGLREDHSLPDIGCGSLRASRLFIVYLRPGRYFGLEPERWLIEEGIRQELGQEILSVKRPTFSHDREFTLSASVGNSTSCWPSPCSRMLPRAKSAAALPRPVPS